MATAYAGLKELAGRAIPTPTIHRTKVMGARLEKILGRSKYNGESAFN